MVGFQKEANYKETACRGTVTVPLLLISPLPNGGRGRAPYPSVGLEGRGGGGLKSWRYDCHSELKTR